MEPYKSELLPYWRFRTPEIAKESAKQLLACFAHYKKDSDFIGMDMTRKFLQMGYTRSRRYANHASGKKYQGAVPYHKKGQSGAHGRTLLPRDPDLEKAQSAAIFYQAWQQVEKDQAYQDMKQQWKRWYG